MRSPRTVAHRDGGFSKGATMKKCKNDTLLKRFESKYQVDFESGCWNWTAAKKENGYGIINVNHRSVRAHRLAWLIYKGEIPFHESYHGMCVLHKCDNRACVNPDHLFLGTQKENLEDAVKKERQAKGDRSGPSLHPEKIKRGKEHYSFLHPEKVSRGENKSALLIGKMACGERHHWAKLTYEKVNEIRRLFNVEKRSQSEIVTRLNVSQSLVSLIVRNKIWKR